MKLLLAGAAVTAGLVFCLPAFAQDMSAGATTGMITGPSDLSNTPVQSNDNGSRIMARNQDVAAEKKAQAKSTTTAMADPSRLSAGSNLSASDGTGNSKDPTTGKPETVPPD